MKILIAPLNWGLGHATRCLPLIVRHLRAGDEVVLAGDGESGLLLRKHFPGLRYIALPPLHLRYSASRSQVGAVLRMLPLLLRGAMLDHRSLEHIVQAESFDLVISDNRFGFYTDRCRSAYITHQLLIRMPDGLRWLEPLAHRLHGRIIRHYTECWVPDYEGTDNLSGNLSHKYPLPKNARFIGPLSRFEYVQEKSAERSYDAVCILSGLEPQRSMLEEQILQEYANQPQRLLVVRGKIIGPSIRLQKGNITIVGSLPDEEMRHHLTHCRCIISRSGYSSLMDYAALGLYEKAKRGEVRLRLIATPGQPEQEYLASLHQ